MLRLRAKNLLSFLALCLCSLAQAQQAPPPDDKKSTATASDDKSKHLMKPITWGKEKQNKLQVGGEVQIRVERRRNFDLDDSDNRNDDTLGFMRTHVNFDYIHGEVIRAFVDIVDARELDSRRELAQENHFAPHQIYIDFKQPGKGPWTLRLGRQEIDLGRDKRLVEGGTWSNLQNTFTGAKAMYRTPDLDVDLFVTNPNYHERRRGDETHSDFARRRPEEWFYGGYATLRQFEPHTIETYFLGWSDRKNKRTFEPNRVSEDGTYGRGNRYTVGTAMYGPLRKTETGTLSYTTEGAFQYGRFAKDSIRAYFLRGDLTYEWKRDWKPSLGLVSTLASGDRDPEDGRHGTFHNLFGSNHGPYGITDFVRPRNMRELALVGKVKPTDKLLLQAEAHAFWADSKTDVGVSAPGESSLRDRTGKSGRELGQEVSLVAEYEFNKRLTLEAGAAHFFPGEHPSALGHNDGANFFYLQTVFKF